jgi:HK97 family phage major capsid protein/HK97 family phage prohead protease
MLKNAYSTLVIKSVDDDQRIIEGIASTPVLDHDGDIMESDGAEFKLPMPLLWLHRQDEPIGVVTEAKVTKTGIKIRAQIGKNVSPEVDRVWALIRGGLARGFSIGSKLLEYSRIQATGGLHVQRWKWLETSVVTIPANQQATISLIKSLDVADSALSGGNGRHSSKNQPTAVGKVNGHGMSLNVSEQLSTARTTLTEKTARLSELATIAASESGLTAEDSTERDDLVGEVRSLQKSVEMLEVLEGANGTAARPIGATKGVVAPPRSEVKVVNLEKGIRFARVARAIAAGRGSVSDTLEFAKRWRGETPDVYDTVKAMVTKAVEGTSIVESPGWGGELVYANNIENEFLELLRPRTVLGRIEGFRMMPFNTRMAVQTGGSTMDWVGEGNVKPVGELNFDTTTLPYHKAAGIIVMTQELVRLSRPNADGIARDDLVKQAAKFLDEQFLNPSITATANRPASITNGVASPAASGTDADALYLDMNAALATFDNNEDADNLYILMPPALARGISTLRNAQGIMEFPSLTAKGGTLMGYPVIVSGSVPSGTIIIVNPGEVMLADDGRVSLDASDQATLDMAGGGTPNFNLWQRNCVAIRAEIWKTWKVVRSGAVAIIDTASYGPS